MTQATSGSEGELVAFHYFPLSLWATELSKRATDKIRHRRSVNSSFFGEVSFFIDLEWINQHNERKEVKE